MGVAINLSFNSKMVRLKVSINYNPSATDDKFQFQNGTIKSDENRKGLPIIELFQFQNGTIKRTRLPFKNIKLLSFNSKMVRLKEYLHLNKTWNHQPVSIPKWYD